MTTKRAEKKANKQEIAVPQGAQETVRDIFDNKEILGVIKRTYGISFGKVPDGTIHHITYHGPAEAGEALASVFQAAAKKDTLLTPEVIYELCVASGAEGGLTQKFSRSRIRLIEPFSPLTDRQAEMAAAIDSHDIVLIEGPAGTGKTRVAIAKAAEYLANGSVDKIILSRPAVSSGRDPGAMPGDINKKILPYMMPYMDELNEVLGAPQVQALLEKQQIETAAFEFVLGRTFKNAFVILDEAQNTYSSEMAAFLTRLGKDSKMLAMGSLPQTIEHGNSRRLPFNGLGDALKRLMPVSEIAQVHFTVDDVVRHDLVSKIIRAYEAPLPEEITNKNPPGLVASLAEHAAAKAKGQKLTR